MAMEDVLIVIGFLLLVMFLLTTFLPKQKRKITLAERVPDVEVETLMQ